MKKMNTFYLRIGFLWDDVDEEIPDDIGVFVARVPSEVSVDDVYAELLKAHDFLVKEDEEESRYGCNGWCPDTLITYVAEKRGWDIKQLEYDIDIQLR